MLQREVSTKRNHEDMKLTSNPTATMAARLAARTARLAVAKGRRTRRRGVAMKTGINAELRSCRVAAETLVN